MSSSKKEQKIFRNKEKKKLNKILIFLVCTILAASVALIAIIAIALKPEEPQWAPFVPPEFDEGAVEGAPNITDPESNEYRADYGFPYPEEYQERLTFSTKLCGVVNIVDGKADIYFTNPEENTLWMKLRVFDEQGNVIAETGLIKPNQYLKTITFDTVPEDGSDIKLKVMTYEPETYYSGGAVSMTTSAIVK